LSPPPPPLFNPFIAMLGKGQALPRAARRETDEETLPSGWFEAADEAGHVYYYHGITRKVRRRPEYILRWPWLRYMASTDSFMCLSSSHPLFS
jgi:hypothetical protein